MYSEPAPILRRDTLRRTQAAFPAPGARLGMEEQTMELPGISPAVYYLRNRTLLLILGPVIVIFCIVRFFETYRTGEPSLGWAVTLGLWLSLLVVALRRRLVLTSSGLEYTASLSTVRVRWSRVNGLVSRKMLGVWSVDGLSVRTEEPQPRDLFIDLRQFSRTWREDALGAAVRQRAPHLFR